MYILYTLYYRIKKNLASMPPSIILFSARRFLHIKMKKTRSLNLTSV